MSEFRIIKSTGIFQPHDGGPAFSFDIDPASVRIRDASEYSTGEKRIRELHIDDGKVVIDDIDEHGVRRRWVDRNTKD